MEAVIEQIMSVQWKNGVLTVRYVATMSDGSAVYGEDVDMPVNELAQLENVAASQRRRLEKES